MKDVNESKVTAEWPSQNDPGLTVQMFTDYMNYSSSNTNVPNKYYNTFIALRNKSTGKTRLIQANEISIRSQGSQSQ